MKYKKIITAGLAMGILFGSNLVTPEHKAAASIDTAGTVINTFGNVYDKFLQAPFAKILHESAAKYDYSPDNENLAFKAPTFKKGEFAISVFDYYKNKNFSKKLKIYHPDGTVEDKIVKHGEQLIIRKAGTIIYYPRNVGIDRNIDKYVIVSKKMLNEGSKGIALTNFQTYFLEKTNELKINNIMMTKFYPRANPLHLLDYEKEYFDRLSYENQTLATITADLISLEDFDKYMQKGVRLGETEGITPEYKHDYEYLILAYKNELESTTSATSKRYIQQTIKELESGLKKLKS
ncbi:hypothetical protein [Bacillus wiedmannii]|uniref:hypothetical protein n=1 Tax=Bacillus wiedmannii TaxID=1890302 RepID=UPI000B4455FB|nr:hypothetical protein BK740_00205 [Bacillus thuringiensis serovar argentinensis]